MIELRTDQVPAVAAIVAVKRGIVKAPAGSGKTVIAAAAVDEWKRNQPGPRKLLWLANTIEQTQQAGAALANFEVAQSCETLITCYQSNINAKGWDADLVILDECHHISSPEFRKVLDGYTGPRWGFSATPERADNLKDDVFDLIGPIVYTVERDGLVEAGRLAPAKVYWHAPNAKDSMSELIEAATTEGYESMKYAVKHNMILLSKKSIDAVTQKLPKEIKQQAIQLAEKYGVETELPVVSLIESMRKVNPINPAQQHPNNWLKLAAEMELQSRARWHAALKIGINLNEPRNDRIRNLANRHVVCGDSALVIIGSIEHGELLQKRIPGSVVMHSKMGKANRAAALAAFRSGELKCVIATSLADEGLDVPRANVLILAAAGRSAAKAEQRTGRVLRAWSDKTHGTIHDFWDHQFELLRNQSRARAKVYAGLKYEFCPNDESDSVLPIVLKSIGITLHAATGMAMPERRTSKKCNGEHLGNPCLDKECWLREDNLNGEGAGSREHGDASGSGLSGSDASHAQNPLTSAENPAKDSSHPPMRSRSAACDSGAETFSTVVDDRTTDQPSQHVGGGEFNLRGTSDEASQKCDVIEESAKSKTQVPVPAVLADLQRDTVTTTPLGSVDNHDGGEVREETTNGSGSRPARKDIDTSHNDSRGGQEFQNAGPWPAGGGFEKKPEKDSCAVSQTHVDSRPLEPASPSQPQPGFINPPERQHARLSPSTLRGKAICSGYINDPDGETKYAIRGTLGHKATETENLELCGDDTYLRDAVKTCVNYEKAIKQKFAATLINRVRKLGVKPLEVLKEIKLLYFDQFGFCDELIHSPASSEAHLLDWKFAYNWYSADSPQFWAYSVGVWNEFPHIQTLHVHVGHPFLNEVDVETFTRKQHYDVFCTKIAAIMAKADANRPEDYKVSYQCAYCGFAKKCATLANLALEIGRRYADDLPLPPGTLHGSEIKDPSVFAALLRLAPVLEQATSGWKKGALEVHDLGIDIPGYKLIHKGGNRKVASAKVAYDVLKKNFIPELTYEKYLEICTVAATQLDDTVAAITPTGRKSEAVKLLGAFLEDEDALTLGSGSRYLQEIKKKK